jgi:two-component system OmpR family response regulator
MDGYGRRILVIDDDGGYRVLLEHQLEQEGYVVQSACDGRAGLEEMGKRRFDAVIADGHMPGLSGLEFAEYSRIAWPKTPVILLSVDPGCFADHRDRSGGVACLHKPYDCTLLLSVLRTAIQQASCDHTAFSMTQMIN